MVATKEHEDKNPSRTTAAKKLDAPREEISGVLRTPRIGAIEWTDRQGSTPEQLEEQQHETLKNSMKPGDENYNPLLDPLVPTSTMAANIAAELEGLGESPTWNALKAMEEDAAEVFEFDRKRRQDRLNKRAS